MIPSNPQGLRVAAQAALGAGFTERLPAFPTAKMDELFDLRKELALPLARYRGAVSRFSKEMPHVVGENLDFEVHQLDLVAISPPLPRPRLPRSRRRGHRLVNPHFQTNIGAVLVDEPTGWVALVATGWARKAGLTAIGSLGEAAFEPQGRLVIRLPDGAPLPPDAQLVAQGTELHVLSGQDWYRIDLTQPADAGALVGDEVTRTLGEVAA